MGDLLCTLILKLMCYQPQSICGITETEVEIYYLNIRKPFSNENGLHMLNVILIQQNLYI
jgi:hypothetical protein